MSSSAAEIQAAIEADLAELEEIKTGQKRVAEAGAEYAKSIAPVDTGTFRNSITAEEVDGKWAIVSDDPAASYIEYGTEYTPEHATFARTADHVDNIAEIGSELI